VIIHDVAQNTPEWRMLRAGIPTASQFSRIVTPAGKSSSQRESYIFQLLGERITGRPENDFKYTWAMERGSSLEHKAVEYFEFQTDIKTTTGGFCTDDLERWGASPDRLVGDNGVLECKAPEFATHIMYLMRDGSAYADYRTQAQSELWVCEREFVWFLSYHPDLPWSLQRVERDEPFIDKLKAGVESFSDQLEALCAEAKQKGWFRRDSKPQLSEQEKLIRAMKDSLIEANR
jgi:hypothetical protein